MPALPEDIKQIDESGFKVAGRKYDSDPATDPDALISIVVPLKNEEGSIEKLFTQISASMKKIGRKFEVVFIDDGSTDRSGQILEKLYAEYPKSVRVIQFRRNQGKAAALSAGFDIAEGDIIFTMDADLQDEPAALLPFLERWEAGFDVVYAVRIDRKESWVKRTGFKLFHYLLNRFANVHIPRDAGAFGLMDRRVVQVMTGMAERNRYIPGMRAWVGFRQVGLPVVRNARYSGEPRVSLYGLLSLAIDGLISFSVAPLRAATAAGLCTAAGSLLLAVALGVIRLTTELRIPGIISILAVTFFIGGIQIVFLGIVGEYVARTYDEAKRRPLFVVDFEEGFDAARPALNRLAARVVRPAEVRLDA